MNILSTLSMLFKSITSITPEPKQKLKVKYYNSPIKLQCIICTDTFDMNTEHNCLLRNANQEFNLKFSVR